jgi:hypothetical protein
MDKKITNPPQRNPRQKSTGDNRINKVHVPIDESKHQNKEQSIHSI